MLCSRVFQRRERVCPAFVSCVLTHSVWVLNMTRDEIIKLMREAGFESNSLGVTYTSGWLPDLLERFAALVAAKEREECARLCDARYMGDNNREDMEARRCAAAIRARGQE